MYFVDIKDKKNIIISLLCFILIICIFIMAKLYENASKADLTAAYETEKTTVIIEAEDYTNIIEKASDATVGISKIKEMGTSIFLNNASDKLELGTGVLISENGYILSNQHVAGNKYNKCYITLANGREYEGDVLWSDEDIDLAIIKINVKSASYLNLGNSKNIKVGEQVFAIGNPVGFEFQKTVTSGIISGVSRTVKIEEEEKTSYMECMIQTDATINNGNSGGPLINNKGEIIGITTVKLLDTEGIGFATPINVIKPIIESFETYGYFEEAYLGIYGYDKDIIPYVNNNISIKSGIYVAEIKEDSVFNDLDVKIGDIITEIDNLELETMNDLKEYVYSKKPGEEVNIKIKRGLEEKIIQVKLKEKI